MPAEARRIAFLLLSADPGLLEQGGRELLACPDGAVFMQTVRLLGAEAGAQALPALLAACGTRDVFLDRVVAAAIEDIARRAGAAGAPALRSNANPKAASLAARLLAELPAGPAPAPTTDPRALLLDADPALRLEAVDLVGRLGTAEALASLARALARDPSVAVRARAARVLSWSPHRQLALGALLEALEQDSPGVAEAVAEGLAALHERERGGVEAALREVAAGGPPAARARAVRSLGDLGPVETLAFLGTLSREPAAGPAVPGAVTALGRRFDERAAAQLLTLATRAEASDDARAAALLAGIPWWRLANPWNDAEPAEHDPALTIVRLYEGTPAVVADAARSVLLECFGQMGLARQRVVAGRLVAQGREEDAALLTELAAQWSSPGRAAALEALGELRRRRPLSASAGHLAEPGPLRERLTATDAWTRLDAVRRAAAFCCLSLGDDLVPLLRDPEAEVREAAAGALAKLGHRRAVPDLIAVLAEPALWPAPVFDDGHPRAPFAFARGAVLDALAELGEDEAALAALARWPPWQDDDVGERVFAGEQALARLARRLGRRAWVFLEPLAARAGAEMRLLEALMATGVPEAVPWMRSCLRQAGSLRDAAVRALAEAGGGSDVALLLPLLDAATDRSGLDLARAIQALLERDPGGCPEAALRALASRPDQAFTETRYDHHYGETWDESFPLDAGPLRRLAAQELARRAGRPADRA